MWCLEPLENIIEEARRAKEGLISGGDLDNAAYTFAITVRAALECAPSLDACVAEVEAGLAFIRRTGSENMAQLLVPYRWVIDVLRGEGRTATGEPAPIARIGSNPLALLVADSIEAMAAAVLGDQAALERHTAEAPALMAASPTEYPGAVVLVLRGLALAGQVRASDASAREPLLSELDEVTRWLGARAADAPQNFLHLLRLLEAERAWAVGDFYGGVRGFDAALREAGQRPRRWHRALITEHAARFYLAHGIEHHGYDLLAQARQHYADWGASAKVAQLDWAYPSLPAPQDETANRRGDGRPGDDSLRSGNINTGTIDLLGILSASQALSSETSIPGLHARVGQVIGAMTGATDVALLVWNNEDCRWLLSSTAREDGAGMGEAAPMSVLRYLERTREPLVVPDATRDERFADDPYFAGADCCSLLAVPILSRGVLRALLLLENRLMRAAFTAERLATVNLIAGQLAVSLDNAQLYTELAASRARIVATADQTRRRIERDLHDGAQQRLVTLALELRMAQQELAPDGELRTRLDHAVDQATGALEELRDLSRGIHPAVLSEHGLGPALRAAIRRSPIPVQHDLRVHERLPDQVEVSAYYIIAEALTNAAKHSQASAITVTAEVDPASASLHLQVIDDGIGGADFTGGTGLLGLKDRADALGGHIDIHSKPEAGTTLHVTLPLTQPTTTP
jgi:signal transduction histidine kinase